MTTQNKYVTCDICDASNAQKETVTDKAKAPYGKEFDYSILKVVCSNCKGSYVVDHNKEEKAFNKAYEESTKDSINTMLNILKDKKFTFSEIERCLELPYRTLSRWKKRKNFSAISVALLRLITTLPWAIRIAEKGFVTNEARKLMISNVFERTLQDTYGIPTPPTIYGSSIGPQGNTEKATMNATPADEESYDNWKGQCLGTPETDKENAANLKLTP